MEDLIASYGGPGLFVVCFIAATILPLSSELAVVAALRTFNMPAWEVLIWASLGNCLGVMFNYWLGRRGSETVLKKSMNSRAGRKALAWTERYGKWTLLLSWLPIVGDPLTIIAGALKVDLLFFIVVTSVVRVLRYAVLIVFQ